MRQRSCAGPCVIERSAAVCLRRDVFSAGASHYGVADCELLAQVWALLFSTLLLL